MVLQAMRPGSRVQRHAGPAVLAFCVYVAMWLGWKLDWHWVTTPDAVALDAAHRFGIAHHLWVTAWNVLCTCFSPVAFRLVALGVIGFALVRRRSRIALFLFVAIEGSALVTEIAKWLANRPRPETAMVDAPSTSFPSGHALGAMVAVLAFAVVLAPHLRHPLPPWAVTAGVAGAAIVISVGVGRVVLNVHHPSDVLAGWALGYLYFLACLPILGRQVTAAEKTPEGPGSAP